MSPLSVKWGDVLSMVLPGTVALLAVRPYVSKLGCWIDAIPTADQAGHLEGLSGAPNPHHPHRSPVVDNLAALDLWLG